MATWDNPHSRVVALLKVVLPLAALVLLSTLFLVSRRISPDAALPYAEVDLQELARESQVSQPRYSSVMENGTAVSVIAASAKPGTEDQPGGSAESLTARFRTTAGETATLTATQGQVDGNAGTLALDGKVLVNTSSGIDMATAHVDARLDQTRMEAPGKVAATAPMGKIDAGAMLMTQGEAGYVINFTGGVKLIYLPGH